MDIDNLIYKIYGLEDHQGLIVFGVPNSASPICTDRYEHIRVEWIALDLIDWSGVAMVRFQIPFFVTLGTSVDVMIVTGHEVYILVYLM